MIQSQGRGWGEWRFFWWSLFELILVMFIIGVWVLFIFVFGDSLINGFYVDDLSYMLYGNILEFLLNKD